MPSERLIETAFALLLAAAVTGCSSDGTTAGAASAPSDAATARTDPLALKTSGEPRKCIPNRSNIGTTPAGDSVLMFRTGSNSWFRNDLRGRCPSMRDDRTLVFRSASSQYCELDTFTVVDSVSRINFGICVLGPFTPVDVPRGARF
jgi:hypothetical protein